MRKVLGIVATQMAVTFAFSLAASASKPIGLFFKHPAVIIICLIGFIGCVCALIANKQLTRKVPDNYIILGVITICEASLIATAAAELTEASVLMAIKSQP